MHVRERRLPAVRQHVVQRAVGEELEGLQPQACAQLREYLHQLLERRQRQQHHLRWRRRVGEFQRGPDDDTQRALRTDRQVAQVVAAGVLDQATRSEEHTSELQSLMRISYAVLCLKKNKNKNKTT